MNESHDDFMDLALGRARADIAKGGRPTCALIVKNGKILGHGLNTVLADMNPNAHAEINAIRDACAKLETVDFHAVSLSGATLYTTMEPCPMCFSTTIFAAKIKRVVLGARHARVGRKDLGDYSVESFLAFTQHNDVEIVTGVREAECDKLRLEWLESLSSEQMQLERRRSLSV